ncbi:MAG: hypothetical protein EAZ53_00925 [Bacteroidetes bacterium]|nr:MAG: hypothetical protein EAZ53_00925 [Bacteroidota bacterium]
MGKIIYSTSSKIKLDSLVDILFIRNYFGYKADAEKYVQKIKDFIETIPLLPLKKCLNPKYGKYYARYDNPKSEMKYFITFNKMGDRYLIKDIISPKTKAYKEIIG